MSETFYYGARLITEFVRFGAGCRSLDSTCQATITRLRPSPLGRSGCFLMFRLLENDGVLLHIGGRALDLLLVLAERPVEVVFSSSGVTNMTATHESFRSRSDFRTFRLRRAVCANLNQNPDRLRRPRRPALLPQVDWFKELRRRSRKCL
jgi:hypothetical protein